MHYIHDIAEGSCDRVNTFDLVHHRTDADIQNAAGQTWPGEHDHRWRRARQAKHHRHLFHIRVALVTNPREVALHELATMVTTILKEQSAPWVFSPPGYQFGELSCEHIAWHLHGRLVDVYDFDRRPIVGVFDDDEVGVIYFGDGDNQYGSD